MRGTTTDAERLTLQMGEATPGATGCRSQLFGVQGIGFNRYPGPQPDQGMASPGHPACKARTRAPSPRGRTAPAAERPVQRSGVGEVSGAEEMIPDE
jgi:hypothetical protein